MRSISPVLLKTPLYNSFYYFGYPRLIPLNFTLLISTACNSRCLSCNIWKQIHEDLTIKEWRQVLRSIGTAPYWFTISGGEPFLQPHLPDLAIAIAQHNQPGVINIPTNSLKAEKIYSDVQTILKHCPETQLVINLSLDGVGPVHDRLRGVQGNFDQVMVNYENMKKLKSKYPNLTVGIHSVISKNNVDHLPDLIDFAFSLKPDQYITEIAEERVELDTVGLDITPDARDYARAIDYLQHQMDLLPQRGFAKITEAFRRQYYAFVKDWRSGKPVQVRDLAGFASCEIASWGEVWPSCIGGINLGNVRDHRLDFREVWFGDTATGIRRQLRGHNDSFPLANAFYTNALCNYHILFRVLFSLIK